MNNLSCNFCDKKLEDWQVHKGNKFCSRCCGEKKKGTLGWKQAQSERLKKFNNENRSPGIKITLEQEKEIIDLYEKGYSSLKTDKVLNLPEGTTLRCLNRNDVSKREGSDYYNPPNYLQRFSKKELKNEIWKNVEDYDNYQVSNLGRIKSVRNNRIMNPWVDRTGRLGIGFSENSKKKKFRIHRLVLETFVGNCPKNMECCHWDGNPTNNRLENLRWDTSKSNKFDRIRHGTSNQGSKHGMSKLNEENVNRIRKLYGEGMLQKNIAILFGVKNMAISSIINRKTWKHV